MRTPNGDPYCESASGDPLRGTPYRVRPTEGLVRGIPFLWTPLGTADRGPSAGDTLPRTPTGAPTGDPLLGTPTWKTLLWTPYWYPPTGYPYLGPSTANPLLVIPYRVSQMGTPVGDLMQGTHCRDTLLETTLTVTTP